jgi:hypothetical protein
MKKLSVALALLAIVAMPAGTGAFIGVPVIFPITAQLDFKGVSDGITTAGIPVSLTATLDQAFPPFKLAVDWGDGSTSSVESRSTSLGPLEKTFEAGKFDVTILIRDGTARSRKLIRTIEVK